MAVFSGRLSSLSKGLSLEAFTRDIWLICLSNAIGALGEGLYFWIFPLYVRSLQADYIQLGLVLSALYGASALAPLPGGFLADRFDRKKILLLSWTPWFLAPLLYSFATNWVQLIPGAICWGSSMIGVPAMNAYVITAARDKRKLASVLAVVWSCYSLSYIFAPALGAYLAQMSDMQFVLRLSALLSGIATGVFLLLRSQHPRKETGKEKRDVLSAKDESKLWHTVLLWSGFFMVANFFITLGRSYVQTFLREIVSLPELYVGLFGSLNFAGITFIGLALGWLSIKWRKSGAIGICLIMYFLSMIPLMLIQEPITLMFVGFLYGGVVQAGSLVSSYVGTVAPAEKRGLWVSIPQTLSLVAAFGAPYLSGYIFTQSPYMLFTISILPMPLLAMLAFTILKE